MEKIGSYLCRIYQLPGSGSSRSRKGLRIVIGDRSVG